VERSDDRIHETFDIFSHLGIPDAQNPKALIAQILLPPPISRHLLIGAMRTAVDLDNQTLRQAGEVNDELIDRHLLSKLETSLLQLSQLPP
jgi:hypothetical protein